MKIDGGTHDIEARHVPQRRTALRPGSKDMARGAYRTLIFAALVALLISLVSGAVMPVRDAGREGSLRRAESRASRHFFVVTPGARE